MTGDYLISCSGADGLDPMLGLDVVEPGEVLAVEAEDHRQSIVGEVIVAARTHGRVADILAVRDQHERELLLAVHFQHHAVAEQLHKLIQRSDPAVEGGHAAVEAGDLASELLRLHQAVLTVEDMGGPGGLAANLSLVNDITVADAHVIGRKPGLTQYGVRGTSEFVINVLRRVGMSQVCIAHSIGGFTPWVNTCLVGPRDGGRRARALVRPSACPMGRKSCPEMRISLQLGRGTVLAPTRGDS